MKIELDSTLTVVACVTFLMGTGCSDGPGQAPIDSTMYRPAATATTPPTSGSPAPSTVVGDAGIGTPSNDTAACAITGGAGAALHNAVETNTDCAAACTSTMATHPNLRCVWGATDITPTQACVIQGGAGAALFNGVDSRGDCYATCLAQATAHPNLSCVWGGMEVAPTGACSIVGGAGAQLSSTTNTRGECADICQSLLATHPNEVCNWSGARIN